MTSNATTGLKTTTSKPLPATASPQATPSLESKSDASTAGHQAEIRPKIGLKPSSFGMLRQYSSINISADKWLLTMDKESMDKLESPPSLADGLDLETEKDLRYLGCEVIQSAAILLKLPQVAAATAQILYQRFFYKRSFVRYIWEHIAMGSLLLASKIEEAPRRPRDIINVFHRLEHLHGKRTESKEYVPMALDGKYVNLKNQVIKKERKILYELGFVVHVNHPHKLIYAYLGTLLLTDNEELLQKAWKYMNDGLRTDIFLRYRPETIACACIFLAARNVSKPISLPRDPFPWYEAFDVSDRDVRTISLMLLQLYRRVRAPNWVRLNDALNKLRGISSAAPQASTAAVNGKESQKAELERKRKEVVMKADEMKRRYNGDVADKGAAAENLKDEDTSESSRSRATSQSSSGSSTEQRKPRQDRRVHEKVENRENRSSLEKLRQHRRIDYRREERMREKDSYREYRGRDRQQSRSKEIPLKNRKKDERRKVQDEEEKERSRSREQRSRSKEGRHRNRNADEQRSILKDRLGSHRDRARDVYKVLGKRLHDGEDSGRAAKSRR